MKKVTKRVLALLIVLVFSLTAMTPAFAANGISVKQLANANKLARQMEDEGIVLLKNDNNLLPLKNKKVNVFGIASCDLLLSGGGSGSVVADDAVNFYEGLEHGGIKYNKDLLKVYSDYKAKNGPVETGNGLIDMLLGYVQGDGLDEMPVSEVPDDVMAGAVKYSDTAIIVLGSAGTEMEDLSIDDIRLDSTQKKMIKKVANTFKHVIVVFNTSNTMQMDWLEDYDSIEAAMLMWLPGEVGAESVGDVLTGKVNPSGKLTDTIAYNIDDYPTTANFGNYQYDGTLPSLLGKYFVEYEEGIYVGYRYFETFNKKAVQYPFGYGLSYTSFDWDVLSVNANSGKVTVKVRVTNTGKVAGKDVVEVYFSAPYSKGGIEKPAIELATYKKTKILKPGKSETLTLTYNTDDMASYDQNGKEAWVLEKGTYKIKVGRSVRDIVSTTDYKVDKTKVMKRDDVTGTEIKNLFDDAGKGLETLSRSNPKDTYPTAPTDFSMTPEVQNCDKRPGATKGEAPKQGVVYESGVIKLADVAKDESLWDEFLDQLTIQEMMDMVVESGYGTMGLKRLGINPTDDNDGPAAVKGPGGLLYSKIGLAYPVEAALACSWNDGLAEEFGKSVGIEARQIGTEIWYAPGCNIRRSPMGGRNFEYFSEDPYISGKMSAAVTRGCQSQGVLVTLKHFVCNDQETNRQNNGLFTYVDEQSLREIYLEPFEIGVKEGNAHGVMTAYNRLGTTWCSASSPLINDLLRNEWGFDGYTVTDAYTNWTGVGYMDCVLAIYARNDAVLTSFYYFTQEIQTRTALKAQYQKDPVGLAWALRDCVYDLCRMKMMTNSFDAGDTTGNRGDVQYDSGRYNEKTELTKTPVKTEKDVLISEDDSIDYEEQITDKLLGFVINLTENRNR
ncbi:MAG: glycoside hydrolase family 3 C-terminal domain-containing protein [Clostridia bacterium]|nr:glycoside hydrolase family 3 C-terminal domain-containing protein [Clostridia bacterium]